MLFIAFLFFLGLVQSTSMYHFIYNYNIQLEDKWAFIFIFVLREIFLAFFSVLLS